MLIRSSISLISSYILLTLAHTLSVFFDEKLDVNQSFMAALSVHIFSLFLLHMVL